MNQTIPGLISYIGTLVQCAVTLVTVVLFWILGRYAARREWFYTWTRAWLALLVALLALVIRYTIVASFDVTRLSQDPSVTVAALYILYQFSKLLFCGLLVSGTLTFAGSRLTSRVRVTLTLAMFAYATFTVLFASNLDRVVAWQAAVLAPGFGYAAWILLALPPQARSLGTRLMGGLFTTLALLWVLYLIGFSRFPLGPEWTQEPWSLFTINNSFIDSLLAMLLSMGMVVVLMESATRETEEVRAARLRDLAFSEAKLAGVIRSASDAIVTVDDGGRIGLFNPAAEDVFGINATEALGTRLEELVLPEQRPILAATLLQSGHGVAGVRSVRQPFVGVRRDGETFPMEVAVSEFVLSGTTSRTLVIRDLTELRQAEEERAELQRQLAHSQKMETVGQLVSGVAHELNNPLAAVLSFTEILLQDPRVEQDTLALTTIRDQARRCRSIVRNLQSYVREGPVKLQPVALQEVLDRVGRAFEPDFAQFGIRFVVDIADSLPPLEADPEGVEQVLNNLVSNAVHAIGTFGEIRLRAGDGGEHVVVTVEDSGPGIPAEVLPRLFEPFFSTKPMGRGTGLGLSVCQGIVEMHGGTIRAANREAPDRGARFTVTLPVHFRGPRARRDQGTTRLPSRPSSSARQRRVLLVEDEAPLRSALRRYFEKQGWRVDEAETGWEALNRLLQSGTDVHYDLVLSDLKMPGMTGIELHDRLSESHPDLLRRFIFITGDVASAEAQQFITGTSQPVLVKPFELATLSTAISAMEGGRT